MRLCITSGVIWGDYTTSISIFSNDLLAWDPLFRRTLYPCLRKAVILFVAVNWITSVQILQVNFINNCISSFVVERARYMQLYHQLLSCIFTPYHYMYSETCL